MRLTRRDAIAALAAAGVAIGGGAHLRSASDAGASGLGRPEVATLAAMADVLYPSELEGVEAFVERYVRGRVVDRPTHEAGIVAAVSYLDDYAEAWYGAPFDTLEPPDRDEVLRRMNVDTASPAPSGSDVERVRYYVVNELLFALYSTPTGGDLVGLESPPGHPGGLGSYQRGPPS